MSFLSQSHHLPSHMTCLQCYTGLPFTSAFCLQIEDAGGSGSEMALMFTISLLPTPEPPLLNKSDRCSNMDMPVRLSPLSLGNTFHCFFPVNSLSPFPLTPLPVNHHKLWKENNELIFLVEKSSICKQHRLITAWNARMDKHETSNTFALLGM